MDHQVKFDHLHWFVSRPEDLAQFLTDHLRGRQVARYTGWGGALTIVVLLDGVRVNITASSAEPREAGGKQSAHFGLITPDLDLLVDRLRRKGFHITSEPHLWSPERVMFDDRSARLQGKFAFVAAPGGVEIELIERRPDADSALS